MSFNFIYYIKYSSVLCSKASTFYFAVWSYKLSGIYYK